MTTPAFPTSIRRALADGYVLTPAPAVIRSDLDSGQARVRRRFTRTPTTTALCFHFRAVEYAVFDAWWHDDLLDGSAWFTITLRNGYDDAVVTARGLTQPEASYQQLDVWRVVWQVEVDLFSRLSTDDSTTLETIDDLEGLSLNEALLHQIVHVDYPATTLAPLGP